MKYIADISSAGNNSFGLVRLLAAIAVIISHGYLIVGGVDGIEPLETLTGYPLGAHAVHVFFTVSGLLVAASFDRRPHCGLWRDPASSGFIRGLSWQQLPCSWSRGFLPAEPVGPKS